MVFHSVSEKQAEEIAHTLCEELTTILNIKEFSFTIYISFGDSFYPEHGKSLEELICRADLALYSAKQQRENRCAFFTEGWFQIFN